MALKTIRKSAWFAIWLGCCGLALLGLGLRGSWLEAAAAAARGRNLGLVRELGLTDLCLFTEARYTRNPSQADLHTPFQDHPMALEHFPAGTLVAPPDHR